MVHSCFKKYAVFKGRASRKEYWMFILFNVIIVFTLVSVQGLFNSLTSKNLEIAGVLVVFYAFAILIPSISVGVRRLHDIGKSGGWWFIRLIPFIGGIWFLVLTCLDSTLGENNYGPNPNEIRY